MTFANALLLAGLAGVAIPLLIHFFTRPRPRKIYLPTYHLLVESGSGQQALSRLRTGLVLALRMLLVAALALLFARPLWSGAQGGSADASERVVLVVDASMSMTAAQSGVSLFAQAKGQATELLRQLNDQTHAGVVLVGASPRPVLPALSQNLAALHEQLAAHEPTVEAGDAQAAVAQAAAMLEGPGTIHILSDFQATNWGALDFAAFEDVAFVLHPVTQVPAANVGLVDVEASPAQPVVGEPVELVARLFNATPARRAQRVQLEMDGVTRTRQVELMPYSEGAARFEFVLPRPGVATGHVTVESDAISADDTRHVRVEARERLKVLMVSDADPQDTRSAAFFVRTALAPTLREESGIEIHQRRAQAVDRGILETADAYVVVSPVRLVGEVADVIATRVRQGAALVVVLSGQTAQDTLASLSGIEGGIEPAFYVEEVARDDRMVSLEAPVLTHPALRLFNGAEGGSFSTWQVRRQLRTELNPARQQDVLLRYTSGDAALALSRLGAGQVALLNLPLQPATSNVAGSPLFPSLIHELMRVLRSGGEGTAATPGVPFELTVAAGDDASTGGYRLVGPGDATLEATVVQRGRRDRLSVSAAPIPGRYAVQRTSDGAEVDAAVVNTDPRETDTRMANLASLAGEGARVSVAEPDGRLRQLDAHRELWPVLLLVAAGALLAEMLVLGLWSSGKQSPRPGEVSHA